MVENLKQEKTIFSVEHKNQLKEHLKKILLDSAHKDYFEKNEKHSPYPDLIDKDITIGLNGIVGVNKMADFLLSLEELKKNCTSSSVFFIIMQVIGNIKKRENLTHEQLKEKAIIEFAKDEVIEEEIEGIEKLLINGIKKWNIISPLHSIQLRDVEELVLGKCRIFVMDKEKREKLQRKKTRDFPFIPLLMEEPSFFEGGVYIETTSKGYHGGIFENSKVIKEVNKNISNCLALLKIIIKISKIKGQPWLLFARPFYWKYIYEEGKENSGQTLKGGEELVISNESYTITNGHIERFKSSYPLESLNKIIITQNLNEIERRILRALEWFSTGFSESDYSHQFIQYCVALESLLGYSDVFTPSSNEVAERVAFLWTTNIKERMGIKKDFKKNIFRIRGKLMHQGIPVGDRDLLHLDKLERTVIISLLKIAQHIESLKTNEDLIEFFDKERFFPQPDPQMLKELKEITSQIKDLKGSK